MKPFLRSQLERYAQRHGELDFLLSREDIMSDMSQFLKLASETVQTVEEAIGRKVAWDFVKFLITRYEPSDGPQTQMAGYLRHRHVRLRHHSERRLISEAREALAFKIDVDRFNPLVG